MGFTSQVESICESQVQDYAGRVFVRDHESDIDISDNQNRITELYLRKRNIFTENQIYPFLSMDDLDADLFDKAKQIIRNYRSDHPWLLVSNEQMLKDAVLWRKDYQTNQEGLTLASALSGAAFQQKYSVNSSTRLPERQYLGRCNFIFGTQLG